MTSNLPPAWRQQIESICLEASGRTFVPGPDRDWFRYRWLGRYLDAPGDPVVVAIVGEMLAGYLVGSLENPAEQPQGSAILTIIARTLPRIVDGSRRTCTLILLLPIAAGASAKR